MAKAEAVEAAAPAGGGKKKLIMILVIVVLLVVVAGAAALLLLKKKPKADEDGEEVVDDAHPAHVEVAKPKPGVPPVYLPMDPFTVNLTDQDVDRYAQVGISLEVVDQKTADQLKLYMPSIRSSVLMVLSHKSASDLLSREGKEKLQKEIQREAVRPLGIEWEDEDESAAADEAASPKKKKKKKKGPPALPVTHVLFTQFIVQ